MLFGANRCGSDTIAEADDATYRERVREDDATDSRMHFRRSRALRLTRGISSAFVVVLVGCGSVLQDTGSTSSGGETDSSAPDVSRESEPPSNGGACKVAPLVGSSCGLGDVACEPRVDVCCTGTAALTCQGTPPTWAASGTGCDCKRAVCGDKVCDGGQVCLMHPSGTDGGTTWYRCVEMPSACAAEWTCGCVQANLIGECNAVRCVDANFAVRVTCQGS